MQSLKKFYFGKQKVKVPNTYIGGIGGTINTPTATQVKLPLVSTGSYNFVVEWGDGTQSTITAWNQAQATKTYTVAGTYQITIKGKCIGWVFNNTGDRLKILSVQQWGSLSLGTNQGNYFYGCANLNLSSVSDILNLSGLSNISYCFRACSSITTINRINECNLMNLNPMGLFYSCTSFNQDLGLLNVSNATSFSEMFFGCNLFNNGGSASINNWNINTGNNISFFGMFQNAPAFNQPLGSWNTSRVTTMSSMFQSATAFNQNLSSWNTSLVTTTLAMFNGAINFNNGLASGVSGDMLWNLPSVTTTKLMFNGASSFNQNLGALNLPLCTNFSSMFQGAIKFNNGGSSDINNWTLATTGSIDFINMFNRATLFNQPIGNWNTSRVTNMAGMFNTATDFNQPLNIWNTSNVTVMNYMFAREVIGTNLFNQDLGSWDVSKVVNFNNMFAGTTFSSFLSFNNGGSGNINNWTLNTTSDINMSYMFANNKVFNQPIGNWNTVRVTNMRGMFTIFGPGGDSVFNQDIGNWNVNNVSDFSTMFEASTWNTSFNNGGSPSINNWQIKTTGPVNMSAMFRFSKFNQDIGNWNVSNVTNFTSFMLNKTPTTFSAANLDAIYNGWSSRPVKTPITISFGTAKYTAASASGRAILTGAPNNWAIIDGGI